MELINHKNAKRMLSPSPRFLCRFDRVAMEIWSHNWRFFIDVFDACFLLLIDVFFLFVSVLNQLHPISATHKISPLEELVGGRSPPSSSQRLTGMKKKKNFQKSVFLLSYCLILCINITSSTNLNTCT
jgi:hypothetical protein